MLIRLILFAVLAAMAYSFWRRHMAPAPTMRASEARTLLGVGEEASVEDIRAAHRRLIARVHPDTGGSAGLATRVNAARDILIAELKRS
jgi:DnaJ family protein C protein 19